MVARGALTKASAPASSRVPSFKTRWGRHTYLRSPNVNGDCLSEETLSISPAPFGGLIIFECRSTFRTKHAPVRRDGAGRDRERVTVGAVRSVDSRNRSEPDQTCSDLGDRRRVVSLLAPQLAFPLHLNTTYILQSPQPHNREKRPEHPIVALRA